MISKNTHDAQSSPTQTHEVSGEENIQSRLRPRKPTKLRAEPVDGPMSDRILLDVMSSRAVDIGDPIRVGSATMIVEEILPEVGSEKSRRSTMLSGSMGRIKVRGPDGKAYMIWAGTANLAWYDPETGRHSASNP